MEEEGNNSTWSHAVGALNPTQLASERLAHLRLTNLSLSTSLSVGHIFIAAGASRPHPLPPFHWSCLLSSHFVSTTFSRSRLISLWIWIIICLSFAQRRSLPVLFSPLFGFPCSYYSKRLICRALVKILPTPYAPLQVLPPHFPSATVVVRFTSTSSLRSVLNVEPRYV